jgi:hypothetical protein
VGRHFGESLAVATFVCHNAYNELGLGAAVGRRPGSFLCLRFVLPGGPDGDWELIDVTEFDEGAGEAESQPLASVASSE